MASMAISQTTLDLLMLWRVSVNTKQEYWQNYQLTIRKHFHLSFRGFMGVTECNQKIIKGFRANNGVVEAFRVANLLILHSIGAKSGEPRVNPLAYFNDKSDYFIVASYQGSAANPQVTIEVGSSEQSVEAAAVAEPDRTDLYKMIAAQAPAFAEHQTKTTRAIPIIRLSAV
ncbi:MAG: deazaflavin-dependent oxidoreductase (nitroreductase family) [Patiriisocius sp.]|jgi:deazaflavin-dependent oxidoreductase (nitroreductase family)